MDRVLFAALILTGCDGVKADTTADAKAGTKAPVTLPNDDAAPNEKARTNLVDCKAGDAAACVAAGIIFEDSGKPNGLEHAAALYEWSCTAKHMVGCYNLSLLYEDGKGVAKDFARAAELYAQNCARHHAGSCSNLGLLHETGRGTPQNERKAHEFYVKGCKHGAPIACYAVGVFHEKGKAGVVRDDAKAREMYKKACDAHYEKACGKLEQ